MSAACRRPTASSRVGARRGPRPRPPALRQKGEAPPRAYPNNSTDISIASTGDRSMVKIQALGYVVAESTDVAKWKAYAEQVLGAATAAAPNGGLYVKLDELEFRIAVV